MIKNLVAAVACDHAGVSLKSAVVDFFKSRKFEILDCDNNINNSEDDYPDAAFKAARAVAGEGSVKADLGVVLCGSGIGVAVAANKIQGIRAAVCNDVASAVSAKAHLNINVLTMGARVIGPEKVPEILSAWLDTEFEGIKEGGSRHLRRINKIAMADKSTLYINTPINSDSEASGRVVIFNHPLVQHKVGIIRDKNTSVKAFRELLQEIAGLMVYEATRKLPLTEVEVETPLAKTMAKTIEGKKLALVPVLRAGLGMVDGILNVIPNAKVGHIGLYRDPETLNPVEYYCKLPADIQEREIFVLDPMLATGGSASAAITLIKKRGAQKISLMCLIAAPEGIKRVHQDHPEVDIFIASLDSHLNDHGYIVPGLGDAGDRIFGTK